ncbi:unnamed protein product, partial [Staurois parvus]
MRTGHPAVMPSAITEAGKTARGWIEEQVRSKNNCGSKSGYLSNSGTRSPPPQRSAVICTVRSRCRVERPARYSDTAAVEIPDRPLQIR